MALHAALKEAAAKLPEGSWEFFSLEEHAVRGVDGKKARGTTAAPADRKVPLIYKATIALEQAGDRAARKQWPRTVTPPNWPGACEMLLHLTADGQILETEPSAK